MKNIITIGREYGSGGYEIGEKLAKALDFKFYDKELIAQIAENSLISETFVENADENVVKRNLFREKFPFFADQEREQMDYVFSEQGRFITNLAKEGNCIIVGRRADYYLKDNPNAFHLFFYADMDFRIDRISKKYSLSPEEAKKKILDMDQRRKMSYEYTTGRDWASRHNYDRMICTSSLGLDACVDEIVALIKKSVDK